MYQGKPREKNSPPPLAGSDPGFRGSDRLWTPWRMQYVGGDAKRADCVFCSHFAADQDMDSLILHRGKQAFVIMNLYPYNTGHIMIIPNDHVSSPEELPEATLLEMATLRNTMLQAIRIALSPAGFNVGLNLGDAAGAGIAMHLHEHIVPRWAGDANFMPIVGGTKVLPELLPVTYAKLRAELERRSATIEVPGIFLSGNRADVFLTECGALPRVVTQAGAPIWRALASDAVARGLRGISILGWGGAVEGPSSAPIIVHCATDHPVNRQQPGGEWVSIDRGLSGPDGQILDRVRRHWHVPDPDAGSN